MKVNNQNSNSAAPSGAGGSQEIQRSRSGGSSSNAASGTPGDSVEFSSGLGSLSRAMESYASSRASQVEALSAQYQGGAYQADSAATSRSMISEALSG